MKRQLKLPIQRPAISIEASLPIRLQFMHYSRQCDNSNVDAVKKSQLTIKKGLSFDHTQISKMANTMSG